MTLLIDIYNLLHQDRQLVHLFKNDHNKAFQKLIHWVSIYGNKNPKLKIICVFDGEIPDIDSLSHNVRLEASGRYQKADDIIKDYIRVSVNPKQIKIITSDRDIISFAKMHFSEWYSSEDFLQELLFLVEQDELDTSNYNKIKHQDKSDLLMLQFSEKELTKDDFYGMGIEEKFEKNISPQIEKPKVKTEKKKDKPNFENKKISLEELSNEKPKKSKKYKPEPIQDFSLSDQENDELLKMFRNDD